MSDFPEFTAKKKPRSFWVVTNDLTIQNQKLVGAVFAEKKIDYFCSINSDFSNCEFKDLLVKNMIFGAGYNQSRYTGCRFENVEFRSVTPGKAMFQDCEFVDINAKYFQCTDIEFINCKFSGKIKKGYINAWWDCDRVGRKVNRVVDNDFSKVEFADFAFRGGVDLVSQKLPDQDDFYFVEDGKHFLSARLSDLENLPNPLLRESVKKLVDLYMFDVDRGQTQLFVSYKNLPKDWRDAFDWLFKDYLKGSK